MVWTEKQIQQHRTAADLLIKIKDETFDYIKNNFEYSEYEISQFVRRRFKEFNLVSVEDFPIVAFRENTSFVHYFPSENSKKLEDNNLILLDIWARLDEEDAPFADITWMAYKGENIPEEIQKFFLEVIKARDDCIKFIKSELELDKFPTGIECHKIVCNVFSEKRILDKFLHTTGHSLGLDHPHGEFPGLNARNEEKLSSDVGYTIEPGIYFKDNFGIRSEINFYISPDMKFILTTPLQKELVRI